MSPTVLLLNQVPADEAGKEAEDGPSPWVPATLLGDPHGAPVSDVAVADIWGVKQLKEDL